MATEKQKREAERIGTVILCALAGASSPALALSVFSYVAGHLGDAAGYESTEAFLMEMLDVERRNARRMREKLS